MTLHAMHCKAEKPHIALVNGWWKCFFMGRVAWAFTPKDALELWHTLHDYDTGVQR